MKKIHLVLIIVLATLAYGKAANSEVRSNLAIEQTLKNSDSVPAENSEEPIIKTVVIEEDDNETSALHNKWITAALAAFGVVLVIVFRMLRKKKKNEGQNK